LNAFIRLSVAIIGVVVAPAHAEESVESENTAPD
jgi:hypothetical protein